MILLASIAIILSVLVIFWYLFIRPIFLISDKSSHEIREDVFPGIIEISKTVITISSAAIVLTVSFISRPVTNNHYLLFSWGSFILAISFGVITLIAYFTHRLTDKVMIDGFSKMQKADSSAQENQAREWLSLLRNNQFLTKTLILLIYLQASTLFIALFFLVIFGFTTI